MVLYLFMHAGVVQVAGERPEAGRRSVVLLQWCVSQQLPKNVSYCGATGAWFCSAEE